jgi:hypothetical protein
MRKIAVLALLLASVANSQPSAQNLIVHGKEDQKEFRAKYWPALKAQGWIFITYEYGPLSLSDVPEADWFFQLVRSRGPNVRSAWVLNVHYKPVGFEPEIAEAPNFQSEKTLDWVNCSEGSLQNRVWHRYRNAFGTDSTVTSLVFPPPIELATSVPAQFTEQPPNSIGEAIIKAICAAPISR